MHKRCIYTQNTKGNNTLLETHLHSMTNVLQVSKMYGHKQSHVHADRLFTHIIVQTSTHLFYYRFPVKNQFADKRLANCEGYYQVQKVT